MPSHTPSSSTSAVRANPPRTTPARNANGSPTTTNICATNSPTGSSPAIRVMIALSVRNRIANTPYPDTAASTLRCAVSAARSRRTRTIAATAITTNPAALLIVRKSAGRSARYCGAYSTTVTR